MKVLLGCLLLMATLSGCYYDSREYLYPASAIACNDTVNLTYSSKIVPILNSYCTSCHSSSNINGNVLLDSYAEVKKVVDNGKLLGSITHDGSAKAMPDGGGKLDDCKIAAFSKWIQAGAPNN